MYQFMMSWAVCIVRTHEVCGLAFVGTPSAFPIQQKLWIKTN